MAGFFDGFKFQTVLDGFRFRSLKDSKHFNWAVLSSLTCALENGSTTNVDIHWLGQKQNSWDVHPKFPASTHIFPTLYESAVASVKKDI